MPIHKHLIVRSILLLLLLAAGSQLAAQNAGSGNWRDSLNTRLRLLTELRQAENFEEAQVEAGALRAFLKRRFVFCPPAAVPLVSGIYWHNKDRQSALAFLGECEANARADRNPDTRAALLNVVIREQIRWNNDAQTPALTELLRTTQDSLNARRLAAETRKLRLHSDSLQQVLKALQTVRDNTVTFDRDRALGVGGAVLLVILALIWFNARTASNWRKRLENKELEHELLVGTLREPKFEPPLEEAATTEPNLPATSASGTSAYQSPRYLPPVFGEAAREMALVIEPNRQVALYVRSLLSDRFDVEMVSTPTEGLKRANDLLPDLIVCDAQLNGQTGIEITRQLKLGERTNHIPVVLLSRHFGNDGRLDALRAGADSWFTRPMLDDEFGAEVLRLLEGRKEQHEQFARYLQLYFTSARLPQPNRFLADIVQHIEQRLSDPDLMPDDLARRTQLTNHHFVKKLRVLTGKEPIQLIRELRLEKAKFLLENRAGTPQAISELVGFSNTGSFAMAFKDYFGENTLLLQR